MKKPLIYNGLVADILVAEFPVVVCSADDDGAILWLNKPLLELFGYAHPPEVSVGQTNFQSELIGQSIEVLIERVKVPAHLEHRRKYNQAPKKRPMGMGMKVCGRKQDGTVFPVQVWLVPVEIFSVSCVFALVSEVCSTPENEIVATPTTVQVIKTAGPAVVKVEGEAVP